MPIFVVLLAGPWDSAVAKVTCKPREETKSNGRVCYDASMFEGLPANKKAVMQKFAPLALYIQHTTGYPASVLLGHMVKEQGWRTKIGGNVFFGFKCYAGDRNLSFPVQGQTITVNHTGCDTWQYYNTPQDSFWGYIHRILYDEENSYYNGIRRVVLSPPVDPNELIGAIARSGYCHSGCSGNGGSYGEIIQGIIKRSCVAHLDAMVLCNYDYEILNGLKPLGRAKKSRNTDAAEAERG